MAIDFEKLKNILEAAILSSELPVKFEQMNSLFEDDEHPGKSQIERALAALKRDYDGRGVELKKVEDAYRFHSREEFAPWLRKLFAVRPRRYSRALLETLSIIAYRQPVTRGDIESIRGVSVSTEIVRTLLNHNWIENVGHRQVPGRPALYGTTSAFLEHFGLSALTDLPALDDEEQPDAESDGIDDVSLAENVAVLPRVSEADSEA